MSEVAGHAFVEIPTLPKFRVSLLKAYTRQPPMLAGFSDCAAQSFG
jgi:hypothetical protein